MSKSDRELVVGRPPYTQRTLWKRGGWFTVAYLGGFAAYAIIQWHHMVAMSPNEFGDFLAGVFSPLAFGWLVLGFLQQGEELRNSAKALRLQGEELRKSVEQQEKLVEVGTQQLDLEKQLRREAEQEKERLACPTFYIRSEGAEGPSSFEPGIVFNIRIINTGASCTDVKVSFDPEGGAYETPFLDGKKGWPLRVTLSDYAVFNSLVATIYYVDALGRPQRWISPPGLFTRSSGN